MGIQDRDYMRSAKPVRRASDQRSPGDPRSANDIFLPGTVHAKPRRLPRILIAACVMAIVMVIGALLLG